MKEMTAINIDKWREVNGGLISAYLDCYSKLSQDKTLNKSEQLYKSLMMFAPTRTASAEELYGTAYTIARELGIFYEENGSFYLSESAKLAVTQPLSYMAQAIQSLMQRYAFNTEFLINGTVVHPTYILAKQFMNHQFSVDDASHLTELIPSAELSNSTKDCLNQFLKRLVLSGILTLQSPNHYVFVNDSDVMNSCTFSNLSASDFESTFIGNHNHKNVVLSMIDRGLIASNNFKPSAALTSEPIGYNKIIYGAPGAGKSRSIIKLVGNNYIRTVFHPETQYSDFIGCLKPHKDKQGNITYSFRKGPFIRILEQALLNPTDHYYLVIEELNRANTAAVFGDIFQLLDRDEQGKSEYPITIQDEDLYEALIRNEDGSDSELRNHDHIHQRELIIPHNLSIIATMNSSDQAVFPLDTAFKRRWIFEYLPIDFSNSAKGQVPINDAQLVSIEWAKLAQAINVELMSLDVVEDKLIGPWFIKDSDLIDEPTARKTLIGKVCAYLWDDALKYKDKSKIFDAHIRGYGQLHQLYTQGSPIFSTEFLETLRSIEPNAKDTPELV